MKSATFVGLVLVELAMAIEVASATEPTVMPSFEQVALQIDAADLNPPATQTTTVAAPDSSVPCHPHLFSRTHQIVSQLNRHFFKLLSHVEDLIKDNPKLQDGNSKTWETVKDGIDRKFTLTLNADGSYSFELGLGMVPSSGGPPDLIDVYTGMLATSTDVSSGITTTNLSMHFDYDALHSVIATERALGQVDVTGAIVKDSSKPAPGVRKTLNFVLTNFLPEEGDPHGPRTGSYTYVGEPGIGGSLNFQDSLILLCPSNPQSTVSNTSTVARWYIAATGGINGRADAKATGGQIPVGDTWMGVSCFLGVRGVPARQQNQDAYWMMKLEDANGNTIQGSQSTTGASMCDPVFGSVPSLTDNATDYTFGSLVTFPNEW